MKTIVYNIHTNLPCGEVQEGNTIEYEINRNAIPNFDGTKDDYSFIELTPDEAEKTSTHELTIVNGKIVFGAEKPKEESPTEPTPLEILQEDLNSVAELTAQNTEDNEAVAETVAYNLEDSMALGETLALALVEIENLKAEIALLKGA